jgi:hypothetical protein
MGEPGLDLDSLKWWMHRASDADAANDSGQCNLAVESLIREIQGHVEELKGHPIHIDIARRLDESSIFLMDEGHKKTARLASELADELVPGLVSDAHKAHVGRQ